jgi:hypothetical protein
MMDERLQRRSKVGVVCKQLLSAVIFLNREFDDDIVPS